VQTNEVLENAYAALQRGDLARAREGYSVVLSREQNNRDALLGLAAIDVRNRDFDTAELRYLKLLELDPRDTHAHAGLIALQGNVDAVQSESRVKNLIASQPDATHLYFTLGNQYAAQSRWIEAQDAYFKAHSAEPENADYAYNLAVSLDQLRQRQLALEYYKRALALTGTKPAAFDRAQVETRIRDLSR
jgi:Flp pilus assembly protein TadD